VSAGPFGAAGGLGPGPTKRGGGGVLKILYWQAPTILSIHLSQGTKDTDASRLVYEPLADFDANDKPVPWLAAEIPSIENGGVAKDGLSVTWKLKKGVKWSDGQDFTANDCVFTWKYASDEATAAATSDAYANVAKVEAVDPTTVKVTFKEPDPAWYRPLTDSIIPAHVFKDRIGANAKNFPGNLKPVGTGPYKVDNFAPGDSVTYSINPNWRDPNGPFWDTVQWKGGGDAPSAARAVFQTGDYDVAWNLQVEPAVLNQLIGSGSQGKLGTQPGFGVEQILLNQSDPNKEENGERSIPKNKHPFLSDRAVRKALTMTADRKTIAETLYGAQVGEPAVTIFNAPASVIPTADLPWEFSLDKANAALDVQGLVQSIVGSLKLTRIV